MRKFMFILALMMFLIIPNAYAATIVFEDDYTYNSGGTTSDAIVWRWGSMNVSLGSQEAGTDVVCWDWNGDDVYSHCYGDMSDIEACKSSFVFPGYVCDQGGCIQNSTTSKHQMTTDIPLISESKQMKVKYFTYCGIFNTPGTPSNNGARYRILNNRQFECNSQGGTYRDVASVNHHYIMDSSNLRDLGYRTYTFDGSISCSSGGCDMSIDGNQANYGDSGESTPDEPCASLCGNGICSAGEEGVCYQDCKPYFSAYNVKPSKEIVYPGETITFKVYFRNYGFQGHADIFGVPVDKNRIRYELDPETTDTLNQYETGSVTLSWTVPMTATPGEYNFRVEPQNYCSVTCSQYPDKIEFATLFEVGQPPDIEVSPTALIFNI